MDFFERQDAARRKTKWLVVYLVISTSVTIAAIYALLALVLGIQQSRPSIWHPELFLWVTLTLVFIVTTGTLYKVVQLRRGGGAVATMLGGRPLNPQSSNPHEQKLLNIVEEMSIASGTPVPEIYIMDREEGINAFAAGHAPQDAAIGVTRGAMELLTRDELQGVIAHEFSHILNGDMRLNLRCVGVVHGLLCVAILGRVLLHTGRWHHRLNSRNRGGNPLPLIGLILYALGSIGVLFGKLIKSAISRQREYLADAAAVQFTRNPEGLAGALKKIGGLAFGSKVENAHAEEVSHMFFGNALGASMFSAFSTHPPLDERIRLLDPAFTGRYPRIEPPQRQTHGAPTAAPPRARPGAPPPILPFPPAFPNVLPGQTALPPLTPALLLAGAGRPTGEHLSFAASLLASLPDEVREAAHDPLGAVALVYGLLLSPDADDRAAQLAHLNQAVSREIIAEIGRLLPFIDKIGSRSRLPLAELAMPALRNLSHDQYEQFSQDTKALIEADREIDLFEYALQRMLIRHLDPHFKEPRRPVIHYYAMKPLSVEAAILLSALAHAGHESKDEIAAAFQSGASQLNLRPEDIPLLPHADCNLPQIDAALNRLTQVTMPLRKQLLNACAHTAAADGKLDDQEAELLRAIADALECPLPPLLGAPGS